MNATHYCGECDGAYLIERPESPSKPPRFCPGCGRMSLLRVEATLAAEKYVPPEDECESINALAR